MNKKKAERKNKEILKNRVQVQEDILGFAGKEIYENITQCLCLARVQMASIDWNNIPAAEALIGEASLLVGKTVKDLRNLAKQLALTKGTSNTNN